MNEEGLEHSRRFMNVLMGEGPRDWHEYLRRAWFLYALY